MNLLTNNQLNLPNGFDEWKSRIPEEGGILLINKDEGWTSFDLVRKIKSLFKLKKVGHAGTLDPLASGLVIIALGKATKLLNFIQNDDKQYIGYIKLGVTTPSYDRETDETDEKDITQFDQNLIFDNIEHFKGEIEQHPPIYSALKFQGKRAYEFARKKIDIPLEARKVNIFNIEIINCDIPFVKFKIDVSKGFYVRSFAYDFGQKLGLPSYLYSLQRTRIGEYFLVDAIGIEAIENAINEK